MAYNAAIFKSPFSSCTFNFNQPNKLLVSHAHLFLLHLYKVITTNFRIVHTINQIHFLKKEIHSLQFGSVGNWSSLWAYNTVISKTHFLLQFQHSSAKQIVSFHAPYLFKIKHTNSPSHFHLFKDTKQQDTSSLTYASFHPTKFFRM
jgi:hypothetical protein